jgi:hypothetical protein
MPLIMLFYVFQSIIVYLWCSSCTHDPQTSQVHLQVMHLFRGDMPQLDPLGLTFVFVYFWCSLKGALKGKMDLDDVKTSTALWYWCT